MPGAVLRLLLLNSDNKSKIMSSNLNERVKYYSEEPCCEAEDVGHPC